MHRTAIVIAAGLLASACVTTAPPARNNAGTPERAFFDSEPRAALVEIDDEIRGQTPMYLTVDPGAEGRVRIFKEGYDAVMFTVDEPLPGPQVMRLKPNGYLAFLPQVAAATAAASKTDPYAPAPAQPQPLTAAGTAPRPDTRAAAVAPPPPPPPPPPVAPKRAETAPAAAPPQPAAAAPAPKRAVPAPKRATPANSAVQRAAAPPAAAAPVPPPQRVAPAPPPQRAAPAQTGRISTTPILRQPPAPPSPAPDRAPPSGELPPPAPLISAPATVPAAAVDTAAARARMRTAFPALMEEIQLGSGPQLDGLLTDLAVSPRKRVPAIQALRAMRRAHGENPAAFANAALGHFSVAAAPTR